MIRFALLAALFAAAPAVAQTKEVIDEVDAMLAQLRQQQKTVEERNEDIEILRRLLNKAFGFDHKTVHQADLFQPYLGGSTAQPLFGGSGITAQPYVIPSNPPAGKRVSQAVGPFDAVYLKGSGVVFTVRVPAEAAAVVGHPHANIGFGSTCNACHQDILPAHKGAKAGQQACGTCHGDAVTGTAVKAPSLSEWELMRLALRGEKPPAVAATVADPKKPRSDMCKPGDLRDLAVAQLHAHAKNVRHLDKNDWFTVVVTFDEVPGPKAGRIPAPTEKFGFTPDELQAITLGDLHLKQGKSTDAAIAYTKALFRFRAGPVKLTLPPTVPAAEVQKALAELEKGVRGVYKSLATAYLHMNDVDGAKAALENVTNLKLELAAAGGDKPKPPLPAKLVLAVAKSDLDRGAKADDLRKGAHVELIGFPPAEKK